MSNPEPDRIKEVARDIAFAWVVEPEWPNEQIEESVEAIEKRIMEAIAQKDIDRKPVPSLLQLWQRHQQSNLTDEELNLMIQKLQEVHEFINDVRTETLFYTMNLNVLRGFAEARKENKKHGTAD